MGGKSTFIRQVVYMHLFLAVYFCLLFGILVFMRFNFALTFISFVFILNINDQ